MAGKGKKICKNEVEALLNLQVKIIELAFELYKNNNKSESMRILALFDQLPDKKRKNEVVTRCTPCVFPQCDTARAYIGMAEALQQKDLNKVNELIAVLQAR